MRGTLIKPIFNGGGTTPSGTTMQSGVDSATAGIKNLKISGKPKRDVLSKAETEVRICPFLDSQWG